jgi:site-specific recombinase XerD
MDTKTALADYLVYAQRRRRAASTLINYHYILTRFFTLAQVTDLNDITESHLDAYCTQYAHLSNATLYKHLSLLRSAFRWFQRKSYITISPFLDYELPTPNYALRQPMPIPDLDRLLSHIPADPLHRPTYAYSGPRDNLLWHFMALAGLRINETVSLKLADLRPNGIYVRMGKGNKSRVVPMLPRLQAAVDRYLPFLHYQLGHAPLPDDYLFPGRGAWPIDTPYLWKRFQTSCEELGFTEHYTFHSLRHTYATLLLQAGVNLPTLQKLLGHTALASTQVYLHVQDDEAAAAALRHPLAAAPTN